MRRFPAHEEMTPDEVMATSYDLLAILNVTQAAAMHLHEQHSRVIAESLSRLLSLAVELHAPMHDALEAHEYLKGGAS